MPFLYKSYAKLVNIIEQHMNACGGQRVLLPSLYPIELLKQSERFELLEKELFTLTSRNNKELYLAPTHEEPITSIIGSMNYLSHRQLPLLLYQIDSKFRNELRPRFGLLRANQFIMKDLYSFDKDQVSAFRTYDRVCESYVKLFNYLGLNFVKVIASNGLMGGKFSHEFHLISKYGEDHIFLCDNCKTAYNRETLIDHHHQEEQEIEISNDSFDCPECKNKMQHHNSIEIGHTFYLGRKYSEKWNAFYLRSGQSEQVDAISDSSASNKIPLEMCCFGIGVTRILSAFIRSKENVDEIGNKLADNLSNALKSKGFNVLVDDRSQYTIGKRLIDSLAYGFPYKIIIGKESKKEIPLFELHSKDEHVNLTHAQLLTKFDKISELL